MTSNTIQIPFWLFWGFAGAMLGLLVSLLAHVLVSLWTNKRVSSFVAICRRGLGIGFFVGVCGWWTWVIFFR
jgi:hypothetical protein